MPKTFAVIYLKFNKRPNIWVFRQKDAIGIANSEDPDQTAPVYPDLSVLKLRIITVVSMSIAFNKSTRGLFQKKQRGGP